MDRVEQHQGTFRHGGAQRRRLLILERLVRTGHVSVSALGEEFQVSEMTVRRDLRALAEDGELDLVHGGAKLKEGRKMPVGFSGRTSAQSAEKTQIATKMSQLLPSQAVIGVDAGTTALACAMRIPATFRGTVVTHSVPVLGSLLNHNNINVIGIGGDLLHQNQAMVGPTAISIIKDLRIDILIAGANAIDRHGIYVHSSLELATKRALIQSAEKTILVMDSTKVQASGAVRVCALDEVDEIVTDRPWNPEITATLKQKGIALHLS